MSVRVSDGGSATPPPPSELLCLYEANFNSLLRQYDASTLRRLQWQADNEARSRRAYAGTDAVACRCVCVANGDGGQGAQYVAMAVRRRLLVVFTWPRLRSLLLLGPVDAAAPASPNAFQMRLDTGAPIGCLAMHTCRGAPPADCIAPAASGASPSKSARLADDGACPPAATVLAAGLADGALMVFDVQSGGLLPQLHLGGAVCGVQFSPTAACARPVLAVVTSPSNAALVPRLTGVFLVQLDLTGSTVLAQSTVALVKQCVTGALCLRWAPCGRYFAVGTAHGQVDLIDAPSKCAACPPHSAHRNAVTSLDFSPCSALLATASRDASVALFAVRGTDAMFSLSLLRRFELMPMALPPSLVFASGANGHSARCVAFLSDFALAVACEHGPIRVYDVEAPDDALLYEHALVAERPADDPTLDSWHSTDPHCVALDPDGSGIIVGLNNGRCAAVPVPVAPVRPLRSLCRARIHRALAAHSGRYRVGDGPLLDKLALPTKMVAYLAFSDLKV